MNEIVFRGVNNQALTNSLLVAEKFGKQHKAIIKAIGVLVNQLESTGANVRWFAETTYEDGKGEARKMYVMTRDGFVLLVMSFNNVRDVLLWKLRFIEAFNAMDKAIKEGEFAKVAELDRRVSAIEHMAATNALPEPLAPMSMRDTIRMLVNDCAGKLKKSPGDIWRNIYDTLYYRYHTSIRSYKKKHPKETYLEVAERNGKLPIIYAIVSNMNAMLR